MNLRNKISVFLLSAIGLFSNSCEKASEHSKLEIYTLRPNKEINAKAYDSLNKEIVYAPQFDVDITDLNKEPLISDEEIICVDTLSGKIRLNAEAVNKIVSLPNSMKHGIKFAICINRKPVTTGYFWSSFSSYGSSWNCIEFNHTEKVDSAQLLAIYKGNGLNASKREKFNFKKYPELLNSLMKLEKLGCK